MGGWRLPGSVVCGLALAFALTTAGCSGSKAARSTVTPSPPTATVPPTNTATPSPTPDPLAKLPTTVAEAQQGLESELIAAPTMPCPSRLVTAWRVTCITSDFDGDSKPDTAFLVPLQPAPDSTHTPAAVFVLRSTANQVEALSSVGSPADGTVLGATFFTPRTLPSNGGNAIAFLTTACSTTGCLSQAHLFRWDGTAWRDVGPGDAGISALQSATWDADGNLILKGGAFEAPGAGPTRGVSVTYTYSGTVYAESKRVYAAPVYLFHAITDADVKFAAADWSGAIAAYQGAIDDTALKDWKAEQGQPAGRPTLVSYALFRIAIATAAEGDDPSVALDKVIVDAKDPIFAYAAQQFRQGWQQTASVHGGCVAATAYLGTSNASGDNPAYVKQAFNYGYANQPVKTYMDICPL